MSKGPPRVRTLMWVWLRQSNSCHAIAQARTSTTPSRLSTCIGLGTQVQHYYATGNSSWEENFLHSTQSTPYTQTRRGHRSTPWVQQQPSADPPPMPPATSQSDLASQRIADLSLQGLVSVVCTIIQEDRAVVALSITTTAGGTPRQVLRSLLQLPCQG